MISEADFASIAQAFEIFLNHRYTRTPTTASTTNAHNEITSVPGAPVGGQRCFYEVKDTVRMVDGVLVRVSTPTIALAVDDPLAAGDLVSDIRTQPTSALPDGQLLLAGPLVVESIDEAAELGQSIRRVATLRGTDVQRAD